MGLAAEAAWCALDQEDFFGYHHAIFENQGEIIINETTLTDLATDIGLDGNVFSQCLSSRSHQADVESAFRAAGRRGISSVPTFFINNQRVTANQPYETFQKIIDQQLAKTQ